MPRQSIKTILPTASTQGLVLAVLHLTGIPWNLSWYLICTCTILLLLLNYLPLYRSSHFQVLYRIDIVNISRWYSGKYLWWSFLEAMQLLYKKAPCLWWYYPWLSSYIFNGQCSTFSWDKILWGRATIIYKTTELTGTYWSILFLSIEWFSRSKILVRVSIKSLTKHLTYEPNFWQSSAKISQQISKLPWYSTKDLNSKDCWPNINVKGGAYTVTKMNCMSSPFSDYLFYHLNTTHSALHPCFWIWWFLYVQQDYLHSLCIYNSKIYQTALKRKISSNVQTKG